MMKYSATTMLTQQTIAYLEQCKMLLKSYEEVETELRMHNWDDSALEEVRQWYFDPVNEAHDAHVEGHNVQVWKLLILGSALAVWSVVTVFLLLVAYEKVSTGRENIDRAISNIIVGLPFMPKTVRYVLEKSLVTTSEAKKARLDASVAVDYKGLDALTGLTSFDASMQGPFDFTDIKKPQWSFNISVTKDFNMDLRLKESLMYFKINKIPVYVTAFLGPQSNIFDKHMNKWISYDTTPLETEARKNMDTLSPQKSPTEQVSDAIYSRLVKKQILPRIKMEKIKDQGSKHYKLHLDVTKDLVAIIEDEVSKSRKTEAKDDIQVYGTPAKASDYIDTSYVDMWIDAKDYYVSKIVFSIKTKELGQNDTYSSGGSLGYVPGIQTSGSTLAMVFVLAYTDYGKPVTVETPAGARTFEDVYKEITNDFMIAQQAIAEAQRVKYDIATIQYAAARYRTVKNVYPDSVTQLVEEGELTNDFSLLVLREQIYLRKIGTDSILIYSLSPDPEDKAAPYPGVVLSGPAQSVPPSVRHYSQAELDAVLLHGDGGPAAVSPTPIPAFY